ncbi:disease resistance protein RPM1-like [Dioscorea cayenensis subsp. rotundata]|uniref:Disease resistance protein RPM1-like n=1 Tax=Dioscorea cayennensis subsp. rotundata TaxID=55577 RepID=A0AB40BTL2_DIOCR|nr:disease resistance protein RPM1-like [Dioscorea cayenensis subsp. rotundata]
MAKSIIKLMLEKLEKLLFKEEQILQGGSFTIFDEVKYELESIRASLRQADAGDFNEEASNWVNQVREIVFDVEDILDDLLLAFDHRHSTPLLCGVIPSVKHLKARRHIGGQIKDILVKLRGLLMRRDQLDANSIDYETPANRSIYRFHDSPLAPLFAEEVELVGIDKPKDELVSWLMDGELNMKVLSVVGMGGVGKSTLVRKVYDDERVKGWFKSHAWVTVTQSFSIEELLRNIIFQLFEERKEPLPGKVDIMEEIQLIEILHRYFRDKRYIVIFDDVWHSHAWESLRFAFPNNHCGSRIFITTRINHVGNSFISTSPGRTYPLKPLSPNDSWMLFCKKVFQSCPGGICPPELQSLSQDIVSMCDGLPLVIAAIGGLLSRKEKIVTEWKNLRDNLHSELPKNQELEHIMKILLLSYNDLPHYLKSCFLYFSMFPRNSLIKRITLIRLWIAEGFVQTKNDGVTLENLALEYLNELIDRSMVQVAEMYPYGRISSCRVHDLIQEIIILKSEEENFSTSLSRHNKQTDTKIRRLSFFGASEDTLQDKSCSNLRALFVFGPNALNSASVISTFSSCFRFLRVMDLEGAPIDKFPIDFAHLHNLRYLSLRNTKISKLSASLGKLSNLQTLDLKGTYITELPKSILKLKNLRHLLAYLRYTGRQLPFYSTSGVKVPQGIGSLSQLQKLTYLEANQDSIVVRELGNLTQLKRLGIVKLRAEDGRNLCSSVEKLIALRSFSVTSISKDDLLDLHFLPSPPPSLQRLYLRGPLGRLPHWVSSLKEVVRMRLLWSNLPEDSLKALQNLPNLVELTLIHAYDGKQLCCDRGFEKLKSLELVELDNLTSVIVEGSMPNLQNLCIRSCYQLEQVPTGIEQLHNLKELHLQTMPDAFVAKLRRHTGADRQKIIHIPMIRCHDDQDRVYEEL